MIQKTTHKNIHLKNMKTYVISWNTQRRRRRGDMEIIEKMEASIIMENEKTDTTWKT